jgi:hypothetical protein
MGRYDAEFVESFRDLESQIGSTSNSHHRKILANFRRHGLLEVSGRFDELLESDMIVEDPVYRLHESGATLALNGMAEVRDFYTSLDASGARVMWLGQQHVAVSDWGFAAEVEFNQFLPGSLLAGSVFTEGGRKDEQLGQPESAGYEPQEMYLLRRTSAFVWFYTPDGRLISEHVYEDPGSRKVIKPDPEDVITYARAAELLAPELAKQLG